MRRGDKIGCFYWPLAAIAFTLIAIGFLLGFLAGVAHIIYHNPLMAR